MDRYAAYLSVDVEAPLRDIFNFLQCLIPGMLVIIRVDDIDDIGEEKITKRLPSSGDKECGYCGRCEYE